MLQSRIDTASLLFVNCLKEAREYILRNSDTPSAIQEHFKYHSPDDNNCLLTSGTHSAIEYDRDVMNYMSDEEDGSPIEICSSELRDLMEELEKIATRAGCLENEHYISLIEMLNTTIYVVSEYFICWMLSATA